jgi:NAD-dependent SIR2 family protein deacetylase
MTSDGHCETLVSFLRRHPRVVVLTGAGLSIESGIPSYRDGKGNWNRSDPIQHDQFISDSDLQQRYWARSFMGWPQVRDARPNAAHEALAQLEQQGRVELLITQNVDRLHQQAGSENVVDLHGRLDEVVCLECGIADKREQVQQHMAQENPHLVSIHAGWLPDGDADLADEHIRQVKLPQCLQCDGPLMPNVVFFGGTVPKERVEQGMQAVAEADALLAVGSSLQVFSGFRFCRQAARLGKPLVLINPGLSRADDLADFKLTVNCGDLLSQASQVLAADAVKPTSKEG